jgi:hypothetical protein
MDLTLPLSAAPLLPAFHVDSDYASNSNDEGREGAECTMLLGTTMDLTSALDRDRDDQQRATSAEEPHAGRERASVDNMTRLIDETMDITNAGDYDVCPSHEGGAVGENGVGNGASDDLSTTMDLTAMTATMATTTDLVHRPLHGSPSSGALPFLEPLVCSTPPAKQLLHTDADTDTHAHAHTHTHTCVCSHHLSLSFFSYYAEKQKLIRNGGAGMAPPREPARPLREKYVSSAVIYLLFIYVIYYLIRFHVLAEVISKQEYELRRSLIAQSFSSTRLSAPGPLPASTLASPLLVPLPHCTLLHSLH